MKNSQKWKKKHPEKIEGAHYLALRHFLIVEHRSCCEKQNKTENGKIEEKKAANPKINLYTTPAYC